VTQKNKTHEIYGGPNLQVEMKSILEKFAGFEALFDHLRCVDPVMKKVSVHGNPAMGAIDGNCFDLLSRARPCDNCISMRAYLANQSFFKIEYTETDIYLITAIPFELPDRRVVVEFIQRVTDSLVFEGSSPHDQSEIHSILDRLQRIAVRDSLTGVFNRRYIDERLSSEIAGTLLGGQSLAIIFADIDYFKNVNDQYGHAIGDCVLKSFAAKLVSVTRRRNDWVARYGGEEFLVYLPGASLAKAVEVAEAMRSLVAQAPVDCDGQQITITASFGVCSMEPDSFAALSDLVSCADKHMYIAKQTGRNKVVSPLSAEGGS